MREVQSQGDDLSLVWKTPYAPRWIRRVTGLLLITGLELYEETWARPSQEEASGKELTDTGGINYDKNILSPTQELKGPLRRGSALPQSMDLYVKCSKINNQLTKIFLLFKSVEKWQDSFNVILSFVLLSNAFSWASESPLKFIHFCLA